MTNLVKVNWVQFDTADIPPVFEKLVHVFSDLENPIEVQHELCQCLEFHHGIPVDFVRWEPANVSDSSNPVA